MDFLTRSQLDRAGNLLIDVARGGRSTEPSRFKTGIFQRLFRDSLTAHDRGVLEDTAREAGSEPQPHRYHLGWRDLVALTDSAGGFLVATDVRESVDILRPYSVTANLGIEIATGLQGDQAIPRISAKTTAQWLATEATGASASQVTIQQMSLNPKTVIVSGQISRQLTLQTNSDALLRRECLRTLGTAIDQAVINGTSSNFQPFGVMNTPGVTSFGAGPFTGTSANIFLETGASFNAPDRDITFLAPPAVRRLLQGRERASGNFIWDRDVVASRPAFVSTDMPASSIICGAWPTVYLGIWGPGFLLELNPFETNNFRSGVVQFRMMLSLDVAVRQPSAFVVGTSIT